MIEAFVLAYLACEEALIVADGTKFTAGQIELYCVFILIFLMFIHVVIIGQENTKGS